MFYYVDQYFTKVHNFFKWSSIAMTLTTITSSFFGRNDIFWSSTNQRELYVEKFDYRVIEVSPAFLLEIFTVIIFIYFFIIYIICLKELLKKKSGFNFFFVSALTIYILSFVNDGLLGSFHLYSSIYLIEYGLVSFIVFGAYLLSLKIIDIEHLKKLNEKLQNEIEERKKAQEATMAFQEKMMSSSKWITLGEMAAGIAHEINNPLMVIKGNAQIIRKRQLQEEVSPYLQKIEKTVDRIYEIVIALKKISRNSSLDPFQSTSLKELLDESISLCNDKIKFSECSISITCSKDLFIECHYTEISQVILNFINNSIDAISESKEKWIKIEAKEAHGFIKLSITDSGQGLSDTARRKIFEPFFTTKEIGKGTGLGMSISKEIIEQHHGSVFINDQSSNTQFVISLPIKQP
jgi:signal transduction histidine kinase